MKIFIKMLVAAGLLALAASPAIAYEPGTFVFRAGVGTIQPKSSNLDFIFQDEIFGDVEACVDIANGTGMTLGGTYMINQNWAFDVLAALPIEHDINAELTIIDPGLLEVPVDYNARAKIGETKQIPPTFSFQYHFAPDRDFQPYFGLGLNWTTFSSTKLHPDMVDDEVSKLILDDSFGVAAQLGGDWQIGDRAVLSLDVRWMDIDSEVFVSGPGIEGKEKIGTVEIDPWMYALNLGYRF